MASSACDDFVLNFDLNELRAAESVQQPHPKYEKLRKSVSWLKSKIISTDFAIQRFQAKKEDLEQSLKAHTVTREELKQVCINYKDASEKCVVLENENKTLSANQEVLKERLIDVETKFDALLSHANQLQMLVKQLENEKDALTIEKELNKCNNKDGNQATELQNEKDEMLKDFTALKDVVLGKKKTSKRHINIIKKYVKDVKYKGPKILRTPEEVSDDTDNKSNISPLAREIPDKVHNGSDEEFISSEEQNFIDNCSDGQVSVDTGRGSSRANSHDKYLSSPDYVVNLEALIKSPKDFIKQVHAANSPIQVCHMRSIATSPIIFDDPVLFEDNYDNYADSLDGPEYIFDDVPLSEEIAHLVEKEKLAGCASPVPAISEFIDIERSPNKKYECIIIKEADIIPSTKSLFEPIDQDETSDLYQDSIIVKEITRCMCNQSNTLMINDKKKLIDACTSPLPMSHKVQKYVDVGINTEQDERENRYKSTVTVGINTIDEMDRESQSSTDYEKNSNFSHNTFTGKQLVDTSTSTNLIPLDNPDVVYIEMVVPAKEQNEKSKKSLQTGQEELSIVGELTSRNLDSRRCSQLGEARINSPEEARAQEKVCLESNSSKKLQFANTNDVEVQNILNVMKLHNNLISPISKTPCDSEYLKLIPEMNCKLAKIWTAIENMYKMPNPLRWNGKKSQNSTQFNNLQKISETQINNCNRNSDQLQHDIFREPNQVMEDDIIDTSRVYVETNRISTDNTRFEPPLPNIEKFNKSKTNKSNLFDNTLVPQTKTDNTILVAEENKNKPQQSELTNLSDQIGEDNINNDSKTNCNTLMTEDYNKEICLQHQNYSKLNDCSEVNNTGTSISETRTGHTIIINGTKSKKKSKLDKLRDKLLPTCKIKKMTSPIIKDAPKICVKPKNTASSASLNQKLAYEKAVKVMAELRANQELQDKKKLMKSIKEDVNSGSNSNNITSSPSETVSNMLSTRSRTRRLSKKEQDTTNSQQDTRDTAKSLLNRKLRKRPADTEEDSLQSKSKRVLRSSIATQITAEKALPEVQTAAEQLHKDIETSTECKGTMESISSSDNSLTCKSKNDGQGDDFNVKNVHGGSQNEYIGAAECDIIFEKITRRTKPVIDLSKCLADNANAVSIIPGSVANLDFNINISPTKKLAESNSNVLGIQNDQDDFVMENPVEPPKNSHCIKQRIEFKKTSPIKASECLMGSKDTESTHVNAHLDSDDGDNSLEQNSSCNKQHNEIIVHEKVNNSLEDKLLKEVVNKNPVVQLTPPNKDVIANKQNIVSYGDLDLYTEERNTIDKNSNTLRTDNQLRKENILCIALDRYGVISVKYTAKKVPDVITSKICQKIEESITKIIASPKTEQKSRMDDLVTSMQNFKTKHILAGLMKYLKDPTRKNELFNKIVNGPAPPMTKPEVILLYVVECLNRSLVPDFINRLWNNMEHSLFQLNRAPQFDVIESMSHFYAVLCRYFRNKSRLRCFMLDAMYCLQFKAVPLIRQCLDVCPGVLPNAHERLAKTSLVTCLVYLLHFYKCQDKFNRAQDIRNILNRKYQYRFSEWNETMILEIFRKAIMDLRGTHNDKKMLRVALIILCKRHGAKWCQLNIIQNMLLPIIEKEEVPDKIKQFCVLMLGPLLKPFPADRKAQCEIVINQLLQMVKEDTSHEMKEAIYSSLIFMNKHDQERVVQALLTWNPEKVTPEFEEILNDYVMEKPLAVWKKLVSKKPSQCS